MEEMRRFKEAQLDHHVAKEDALLDLEQWIKRTPKAAKVSCRLAAQVRANAKEGELYAGTPSTVGVKRL